MRSIEAALLSHAFLSGINPAYVMHLADCAETVEFKSGDFILRQGSPANEFYLIRSGRVDVELFSGDGGPIILRSLAGGDVLGWSWLIPPYHWTFDARALEDTQAIRLSARELKSAMDNFHEFGYEMLRRFITVIADRLEAEQVKLLNLYAAHS